SRLRQELCRHTAHHRADHRRSGYWRLRRVNNVVCSEPNTVGYVPFLRPSKTEAKEQMAALVDEYQLQAGDLEASNSRYTEAEARGQFIDRFLTILGWDVHNLAGQPQILRDVVLERISKSDVGGRPDYRLRLNGKDRLPVEAKKP